MKLLFNRNQRNDPDVEKVCQATGWKKRKAITEMKKAKELGMSYSRYADNQCWKLTEKEMIKLNKKLDQQEEAFKNHTITVCDATGWDMDTAALHLRQAQKLGMSNQRYVKCKCWYLDEDEIAFYGTVLKEKAKVRKMAKEERIRIVCEESGWSAEQAEIEMEKSRKSGISNVSYVKYQCWNLEEQQLQSLAETLKEKALERKSAKEKRIAQVCQATGWKSEQAEVKMNVAKECGITNKQYVEKYCYDLTGAQIIEYGKVLEDLRTLWSDNRDYYLKIACRQSGWEMEKQKAAMEEARSQGISYQKYIQFGCWKRKEKELEELAEFLKSEQLRIKNDNETYLDKICQATGWKKGRAEFEVMKSKVHCYASHEDYSIFRFYDMNLEEQQRYVTFGIFDKMRIRYNDYEGTQLFNNKGEFNTIFRDYIKHTWFLNRDLSYDEFVKQVKDLDYIMVKPLDASKGVGIQKYACPASEDERKKLYEEIMNQDSSIIEECIVQHEDVAEFCPTSVNTIRITTLNYEGDCKFLYAVFRMGRGGVVDNFHAGGIAATIDIPSGMVCTSAADLDGNTFEENPYSGKKIKGYQIPNWDRIIETCKEITGKVSGVNLVGWDFAITPDDVDLIEGNPGVSYVLAQVPNVADHNGLRPVMVDPYM